MRTTNDENEAEIARLEAVARKAWPAASRLIQDGWLLCESGGGTRRAQSVQPIEDGTGELAERIAHCERFYAERNARCVFKLTPASRPVGLDAELERLGYARSDETHVQTSGLSRWSAASADARVMVSADLDPAWRQRCTELTGASGRDGDAHARTLDRVAARAGASAFARVVHGGVVVALGLGAVEDETLFLGDIVTDAAHRGAGLGRALVEALLIWGAGSGADRALLQVTADNQPALRLYQELGFETRYSYWYRAAPLVDQAGA